MKLFLLTASLLCSAAGYTQEQTFNTKKGDIVISPIQHATFTLTWNNKTVFVDPTGNSQTFKAKPDLILLTDIHGDHLDLKTLEAINTPNTTIIAPQAVADKLSAGLKDKLIILKNGDKVNITRIKVKAIPMYNLPQVPDAMHPKGRGNGYLLTLGGKNVYISGDTEDIPEMRALKHVDIAFICMNLPYTMDINQAASAVLDFKPKVVFPYHYRGQGGFSDINKFKEIVNTSNKKIDVRILNWYTNN